MKFTQNLLMMLSQKFFRVPTAKELAIRELEEAKREQLQALTALDYSKRMVEYHGDRIKRLAAYVEEE
jgi:predicted NAD/FAD-binding protein